MQNNTAISCYRGVKRKGLGRAALGIFALLSLSYSCAADDLSAVRVAVFDYFEGINEVSPERLQRAFAETAALKSIGESGELVIEPIAHAIARWAENAPRKRSGKILSIDVSAESIARVTFDFDGTYLDFLTLAKIQGEWKIIDKVFVPSTQACCDTSVQ